MNGPCAKQVVTATIVTPSGKRYIGNNYCLKPQTECPRKDMPSGQGYHLCKEVCFQPRHAEANALLAAGEEARGAYLFLEGHTYACDSCQRLALDAGVRSIIIGAPPK